MAITVPTTGQTNWDVPLDAALTTVDTEATNAQTSISSHAANNPVDPHGDRAYTDSKVNPITSGTNLANGYVKLDNTGHIPASLISGTTAGGMYTNVFDAVGLYGMKAGTGSDQSVQLQNALNAAATSGGGIVYVGPGTYSLSNYVVIGSNTWLLLSEGCVLQRIAGATNAPYIISNIQFGTSNLPSTGFKITGGKIDAVGSQNLASACTPIFIFQASKVEVRDIFINNVFNNPAIEINGSNVVRIDFCHFNGTGSNSTQATVPCIRLNSSEASTTPPGLLGSLYNNTASFLIKITDCEISGTGSAFGAYGEFCGTDLTGSGTHINNDIAITAVSTRYASNNGVAVDSSHWSNWTIDNCLFYEAASSSGGNGWINITSGQFKNGWANGGGGAQPMQYKLVSPNLVYLRGTLNPGTTNNNTIIFTLPSALGASHNINIPATCDVAGIQSPHIVVDTSGNVTCYGVGSTASNLGINGTYSLDA